MSDAPKQDNAPPQLDVSRLARPGADALSHLAEILGVRYAGAPGSARTATAPRAPQPAAPRDARTEALLSKLPLALLVISEGGVSYINRRAQSLLGYHGAQDLERAGGLARLFIGGGLPDGAIALCHQNGHTIAAIVEVLPIDWAAGRAVMLSVEPVKAGASPPKRETTLAQGLKDILAANPNPVAILTDAAALEAANEAFAARGDTLQDHFGTDAPQVVETLAAAFAGPGASGQTQRVHTAAGEVAITVLGDGKLACLEVRPAATERDPHCASPALPQAPDDEEGAVALAVHQARGLLRECAIVPFLEGDPAPQLEHELSEETTRFFRAMLLLVGARAPGGTVITLSRRRTNYALSLRPASTTILAQVAASARLVLYGLEAGLAMEMDGVELRCSPLVTGRGAYHERA